jgi:antitoxin (DNA-binding transcriptional repressor) of toxin-antitoxin stability system
MRFVSVRELRGKSAAIWKELADEKDLVVTSNGKPIALLSATSEELLEESLVAVRRARALAAVTAMQQASLKAGTDRLSLKEIGAEIAAVRKGRSR